MNRKFDYTAQIESYLEGRMSGDEMKAFEANLQNDPAFEAEFQLQKDIIDSLKEYRKQELKSRLDQVNVASYGGNLTGIKIAFTAAITAAVGWGVYQMAIQEPDNTTQQVQVEEIMEAPAYEPETLAENTPVETNTEAIAPVEEVEKVEEVSTSESEPTTTEATEKIEEKEETPAAVGNNIGVVTPKVIENFEGDQLEENATEIEAPKNKLEERAIAEGLSTVEIENEAGNANSFHYKFYNNKLYLYGDFKNIPYEIIEFNTVSGKSLYLYYQGNYYYLELNQMEMTPLPKIHEEKLIEELDSLRVKN